MKRDAFKISFAIVIFLALGLFILNPAYAVPDCYVGEAGVWNGNHTINDLTDLEALSGYTSVTGDLTISDTTLTSLDGLECLTHVGGFLYIEENDSLTSLAGLEKLEYVGDRLAIWENDSLTGLAGLEKLKHVGIYLYIEENDFLTSLAGLERLKYVGFLRIFDNDSLTSLAGLEKLEFVGGYLRIKDNDELCTRVPEDLRDQVLDAGGIGGFIDISGNDDTC